MKLLSLVTALVAAGSASAFAPAKVAPRSLVSTNMAASEELYIDEERRFLMNLILVGSGALTIGAMGVPFIAFFVPPGAGGGSGGTPAKDALGNEIFAQSYIESKGPNDRSLAQGLKGDATYLIVKEDKTLESYGLNAGKCCSFNSKLDPFPVVSPFHHFSLVCTHLGCVVPWSSANNKFMCPCHGSQYSPDGSVVRGPAPLPLALAHCDVGDDGKILFSQWTEDDFRTGEKAWWN